MNLLRWVFPARAGMNRFTLSRAFGGSRVPRASGDEPDAVLAAGFDLPCSPRERG